MEVTARPVAVWHPHPLLAERRELCHDALLPGETLADYLERTGLATAIGHHPVVLAIDGYRLPRALWGRVRPKPGTLITIQAIVHGGGGKKNPVATLLSLAIAIVNPGALVAQYFGVTGLAGTLLGGGINVLAGLVGNALFPPPSPEISAAQAGAVADSPTYSLTGGANRARLWEPLPVICGTHRVAPDLGARTYTETEGEDSYLYQIFNFGYNTVTLSDWKIGATPLSSFTDWTMETSGSDGVLTSFPGNVDSIAGGTMDYNTYIQRTGSPGTTALAVEIAGSAFALGDSGEIQGASYAWTIEYRAVGSASWLPFVGASATVTGAGASGSRTPLRRTFKRDVAEGQYEVRVSSQTNPAAFDNADRYTFEFSWTQLRSYQPDTADYNGQQRVALKIKANGQLNGQVDQLTAIARAQCEVWTGAAWVEGETSNPAWWFRAVALGRFETVNGRSTRVWGAGLSAARVDDAALKAWGAWCDAKALTFNGVFDRPMSAAEMLQAIATCGRASMTWSTGKLGVVYDQADQPVTAVFGMANILAGTFEISYQTEELADEVLVGFINPDLDWQRDQVRCRVPGVTNPTRPRTIELFGCTSLDMAGRAGNLYAAQQAYRRRTYRWHADWEGMAVTRGDVVQLSHDLASWDWSGRLVEGTTAGVLKLDRKVTLSSNGGWIVLIKPDQTFATYAVTGTGAGETDTLTLASALAFNPAADPSGFQVFDYKWLFGATATPGRTVKITSLKPMDESTVEITAIDELEVFYASEDGDYVYEPPRRSFGSPAISNLAVIENGIRAGLGYAVQLTATWDTGADYSYAELWAAVNGGPETRRDVSRGRSGQFIVNDGDVVALRVVAFSSLGRLGQTTQLTLTHTVAFAGTAPPADVTTFLVNDGVLSWLPVADVDVAGYRVRFNQGSSTDWGGASALHQGLLTASPWAMPVRPTGYVTLMIKAVDASGQESVNARAIYVNLGDAETRRVVETIDLDALGYPGTLTGGTLSGGDLVADSTTAFWDVNESAAFWAGSESAAFWPATSYAAMVYEATVTPTTGYSGARMTVSAAVAAGLWSLDYRPQGADPFWGLVDADPFWGADAAAFWGPPPDWQPWPGALAVTAQPYDLRISTSAGATQGVVSSFTLTIDVPIIGERVNDVAISAGGTRLPLGLTYALIDNVQLTLQADGGSAIAARVEDKNAALGPLVRTLNTSGSAVAGVVDAYIQGIAP